ncbi:MAG: hypothetical protein HOI95_30120 [Chromatiales bacterium]|jgi:hypothetical protein|nr:hypothetical protein [Chromatiales bacterium]
MVLAFYPAADAGPLILDTEVRRILPLSERPDLRVVYSFNAIGVWRKHRSGRNHWAGSPVRLRAWWDVMRRFSS